MTQSESTSAGMFMLLAVDFKSVFYIVSIATRNQPMAVANHKCIISQQCIIV